MVLFLKIAVLLQVCNNAGHCHCPNGFRCPRCDKPGPGGSVDSGMGCHIESEPINKSKVLLTSQLESSIHLSVIKLYMSIFYTYTYIYTSKKPTLMYVTAANIKNHIYFFTQIYFGTAFLRQCMCVCVCVCVWKTYVENLVFTTNLQ